MNIFGNSLQESVEFILLVLVIVLINLVGAELIWKSYGTISRSKRKELSSQ